MTAETSSVEAASSPAQRADIDVGAVEGGKVSFPEWGAPSDKPTGRPRNPDPLADRVGFAVVGLGRLSLEQILPALVRCKTARLTALVSGSAEKLAAVGAQYGVGPDRRYAYDEIERLADAPDVEAVYVVLPNNLHEEFVLRAARAGKHVLCEKPMADGAAAAERMVEGCKAAGRLLMVAYRSQFEPHLREVIRSVNAGEIGKVKLVSAINVENLGTPAQWRLRRAAAGGGSLPDVGLYGLNVARAVVHEEPVEVAAQISTASDDPRFAEVEDQVSFLLRFPSGALAAVSTGYDGHKLAKLIVNGQTGSFEMDSAFEYAGQRLRLARRVGDHEEIAEVLPASKENQFVAEIDHMAECVRSGATPRTPGEEGVRDHRLMEAIYRSAADHSFVKV